MLPQDESLRLRPCLRRLDRKSSAATSAAARRTLHAFPAQNQFRHQCVWRALMSLPQRFEMLHFVPRTVAPVPPPPAGELTLTTRQIECLEWIARGKSSTDIGVILNISGRTVDYHVAEICDRLNVRTRLQAVTLAILRGWIRAG